MMNLDTPYTPSRLCTENRKMLIPIYQRLFVWDAERIMQLLRDLYDSYKSSPDAPYYIGVITVWEDDKGVWHLVDGQQRLTFLTLLGVFLVQAKEGGGKWRDFVLAGGCCRIKYEGRKDEEELRELIGGKGAAYEIKSEGFRTFRDVFKRFCIQHAKEWQEGTCSLAAFSEYCISHASFLVNCLPREYGPADLNLYFEKMNSTGKQLAPIDVVKGRYFAASRYVDLWNRCLNFDERLEATPEEVEAKLSGEDSVTHPNDETLTIASIVNNSPNELGRLPDGKDAKSRLVMRGEVLLLHVLRICKFDESALDYRKLIAAFDDCFGVQNDGESRRMRYIKELCGYRRWIDENVIYLHEDNGVYDYALRSSVPDENEDATFDGGRKMRQFQSMLYVSSGENQDWVLEAYLNARDENGNARPVTLDELRSQDDKRHCLGADKLSYQEVDRYWFWKLDYLLWEKYCQDAEKFRNMYLSGRLLDETQDKAIRNYKFRRNISIEHLHPQSDADENWGCREQLDSEMHKFGNLAMMSVESNSAQSNDPIEIKFGRVKAWIASGKLESIKLLLMFNLADSQASGWTVEKATTHCELMKNVLQKEH